MTIVSHLKSSFIDFYIFCLWFVFIHLSSSHQRKHNRLASRACVYAFCVFLSRCLCVSVWSLLAVADYRRTEESGCAAACVKRPPRFACVPATGLDLSDGIKPIKRRGSQYDISVPEPKKCGLVFSLSLKCRCERNERHTRSCFRL